MARGNPTPSTSTISSTPPPNIAASSSPIATVHPSASPTWARSSTTSRTCGWPAGSATNPPCSWTFHASPTRTSSRPPAAERLDNVRRPAGLAHQPAVLVDIQRQPDANIIQTADRVKALLPRLRADLPASVQLAIFADRTETIRASVADVQFTLLLTVALVVVVIFLFLRKFWATVIPSVALPLTLIGTFGVMKLAGFNLDNLSLMALTISTGFVVDDAIVMIENIVRFIEEGESPMDAALKGARQIGFTIISLSVSLVAVFIPLLFMTGIVGRLFREFAITLSVAVGVSAFVSLTLTPMMCAKLLRAETEEDEEERTSKFYQRTEEYWTRFRNWYERGLRWVLAHQRFVLMVAIVTLVATILLYIVVPKGLLPQQDTGVIIGVTDAAENISFKAMMERVHDVSDIIRKDPDVASVSASVGAGTVNATINTARLYIVLKPHDP